MLLPDQLMQLSQHSKNDLGLIVNNMQNVYSVVAASKSKSENTAGEAFTAFLREFKDIVRRKTPGVSGTTPLIALYNASNLKKAQSLD